MPKEPISIETLRSLLRLDPDEGRLFWLPRQRDAFTRERLWIGWNRRYAGTEALSTLNNSGYKIGGILNEKYLAHRVIWAIHSGYWPNGEIDHINGVRDDNRITNLRDVSSSINKRNTKLRSDNTSGTTGVVWNKLRKKWQAQMVLHGKIKGLGYYDDINDAVAARLRANAPHQFTDRHGL